MRRLLDVRGELHKRGIGTLGQSPRGSRPVFVNNTCVACRSFGLVRSSSCGGVFRSFGHQSVLVWSAQSPACPVLRRSNNQIITNSQTVEGLDSQTVRRRCSIEVLPSQRPPNGLVGTSSCLVAKDLPIAGDQGGARWASLATAPNWAICYNSTHGKHLHPPCGARGLNS